MTTCTRFTLLWPELQLSSDFYLLKIRVDSWNLSIWLLRTWLKNPSLVVSSTVGNFPLYSIALPTRWRASVCALSYCCVILRVKISFGKSVGTSTHARQKIVLGVPSSGWNNRAPFCGFESAGTYLDFNSHVRTLLWFVMAPYGTLSVKNIGRWIPVGT
jgi:hypothetical protein